MKTMDTDKMYTTAKRIVRNLSDAQCRTLYKAIRTARAAEGTAPKHWDEHIKFFAESATPQYHMPSKETLEWGGFLEGFTSHDYANATTKIANVLKSAGL